MMRRNLRKAMSAVLVAAMTLSTPIAVNQHVTVAQAEEADSNVISKDTTFTGDEGKLDYDKWNDVRENSPQISIKKMSEHEKVKLVFTNKRKNTESDAWFNFALKIKNTNDVDTFVRADNYAWFGTHARPYWGVFESEEGGFKGDFDNDKDTFNKACEGDITVYAEVIDKNIIRIETHFADNKTVDKFELNYGDKGLADDLSFQVVGEYTEVTLKSVEYIKSNTNNFEISSESTSDKSTENGTVYYSKLGTSAYYNDTVEIETDPAEGFSPYAIIKCDNKDVDYKIVEKDGKQFITFTMPKGNVTIDEIGFNGLNDVINTAKPIYETKNKSDVASTKYTEDSFKTLTEAYEAALKVSKDEAATSKDKASAKTALESAIKGLIYKCDVTLDKDTLSLYAGDKNEKSLTASVITENTAENATEVTWSTDNASVLSVDKDGKITGLSAGTANVIVTAKDGSTATCKVTVIENRLIAGTSDNFAVKGTTDNAEWASSDENVATVNANGTISAVKTGNTKITATVDGTEVLSFKLNVIDGLDHSNAWDNCSIRTPNLKVSDAGTYLSFVNNTNKDAVNVWDSACLVITNASGSKSWTLRGDLFGWGSTEVAANLKQLGNIAVDNDWLNLMKDNAKCYVSAEKVSDGIQIRYTTANLMKQIVLPATGEDYYVYLSGEHCKLSDIKVLNKEEFTAVEPAPFYQGSVGYTAQPAATPGPDINVPIYAEDVTADETLTGTEWWTGMVTGKDYSLSGKESSTELYVAVDKLVDGYGAFSVEAYTSDRKFFTTGSDKNAWTAEQATGSLSKVTPGASELVEGHVYKITVTRKDADITIKYYDATTQKDVYEVTLSNSNFDDDFMVHILAQKGTFSIGQKVTVDPNRTPAPTTTGSAVTAAPTDTATTAPTTEPSAAPTSDPGVTTAPTTAPSTEPTTAPATVKKGDKVTVSGAKYVATSSKEVSYTAAKKATASVVIPATVKVKGKTLKVTSIAAKAFKGNKTVKSLTVGKNVTTIGANAFNGCKKLKTLTIKSTKLSASKIAKNAFKGISKKTTVKVPKNKLKAYKKLLRKKGLAKSVGVKSL